MDLEHERKHLLQRDGEWAALASEGREVERMLSYWTSGGAGSGRAFC